MCCTGILIAVFQIATATLATASQIHPINITDTRPITQVQGLPAFRSPEILSAPDWNLRFDYDITNHFSHAKSSFEAMYFDGVTQQLSVAATRGIWGNKELTFYVPFIQFSGGTSDAFIEKWHEIFGLPQNGRNKVKRNQLYFYYMKDGVVKLNFAEPTSGMGDVQIIVASKFHGQWLSKQDNLAFKAAVKLPTGDSEKLTGSGSWTVSGWFAGDFGTRWFDYPGTTYASLGASVLGQGDIIPDQQRRFALFGGMGSGAQISNKLAIQVQVDMHSPLYNDSVLTEINSFAFLLTFGGTMQLNDKFDLELGVVEDLMPHASPDVIFHAGLKSHW